MQITLTPCRGLPGQAESRVSVAGDVLTVDGIAYDLSAIPDGGEATPEGAHPFTGVATRDAGEIHCTVRVVLDDSAAPDQPESPWVVTATAGDVPVPAIRTKERAV